MVLPILSQKLEFWWLDNLINLQPQWILLALLSLLVSIKYLKYLLVPLSLLYVAIIGLNLAPLYLSEPSINQGSETLTIAQFNIMYENPNMERIISSLVESEYDVVLVQEVGDDKTEKIAKLIRSYPYSIGVKASDEYTSRQVLFSRWPIVEKKVHDLGYVEGSVIEVIILTPSNNTPVQIYAFHPGAPRNKMLWRLRNRTLEFVAGQVSASRLQHKIVIGDFNTSPWSPEFKNLESNGQLKNSANGYGYIPSWALYSSNKLIRLLSSAYIDHCLVSRSVHVHNKQYHFIDGSDHLLISTELGLY